MPFDSKKFLAKAPETSGVYQMLNAEDCVIYVGKAKNLKARLRSYFQGTPSNKTRLLVQNIENIQLTITHTEAEALLLEHTLIKQHMPRYNILLRDDKSFPYLYLSEHPQFPSLSSYRGIKRSKGQYFGPYVSTRAMLDALHILQKLFKLRSCHDTMFNNRSRPCLQYQIKRCKAPCVNLVSPEEYQQDVTNTTLFLQGKSQTVITNLVKSMDQAAEALDYEKAAQVRDLIASLQQVQQQQYVINKAGDVDVIAAIIDGDQRACVAKLVFRAGQLLGNKWYFPKTQPETPVSELLTAFVTQHYIGSEEIPKEIIVSEQIDSNEILSEILSKKSGRMVKISVATRGTRKQWLQ
ncbi:MAG: excinuclease ABC subunit UvrC, partial [Gammaproteobacteria bacterium]|nr:excinuclease ABC subunit UvrC [Gammaproteobacteria bacterium]